jgi:hypothetical protein
MTIYKGIAFPFQFSAQAFPAPATDNDLIKQSLVQIIMTSRTERVMRPDFGSDAYSYIFESLDENLAVLVRSTISGAIAKYEPRVLLLSVDVVREDSQVIVTVSYVVIATNDNQTLTLTLGSP